MCQKGNAVTEGDLRVVKQALFCGKVVGADACIRPRVVASIDPYN